MEDEELDYIHRIYEEANPDIDFNEIWSYLKNEYGFKRFADLWSEIEKLGKVEDFEDALMVPNEDLVIEELDDVLSVSKKENRKQYYTKTL